MVREGQRALSAIEFSSKPVVMAIYHGICMGGGLDYFGRSKAIELALTGSQITATEAYALGAVNHVMAGADVLPKARAIADGIARMRTKSVKGIMTAMHVPYRNGRGQGSGARTLHGDLRSEDLYGCRHRTLRAVYHRVHGLRLQVYLRHRGNA